jgi:hypothetical protein
MQNHVHARCRAQLTTGARAYSIRDMKVIRADWVYFLFRNPLLTFALMGICFVMFGVTSINLFFLLKANISLFIEYGMMVIEDGALDQLFELLGMAYLSMMFYIIFKVCERILVERLTRRRFAARWRNTDIE